MCPLPLLTRDGQESDKKAERAKLSDKKMNRNFGVEYGEGKSLNTSEILMG